MIMTVEEMYEFKARYEKEIEELKRKKAVVDEFIAFTEAKGAIEDVSQDCEPEDVEEETATAQNF